MVITLVIVHIAILIFQINTINRSKKFKDNLVSRCGFF